MVGRLCLQTKRAIDAYCPMEARFVVPGVGADDEDLMDQLQR